MNTFRAVAIFPHIAPGDLEQFCLVATELMKAIQQQESTLRYDIWKSSKHRKEFLNM
jgi:quinol monooxygenase YgiN